jgi:predicted RNA binding protein YcfA (HicA-like mRNA interferase family)
VPRKVRQLIAEALACGMEYMPGRGKGSHRLYEHKSSGTQVYLSGHTGDDADHYQERDLRRAIEQIRRWQENREA